MPVDHKRINGPDNSVPYHLHSRLNLKTPDTLFAEILNAKGKRQDGRDLKDHRKVYLKSGLVSQAKGSAYIELDDTKVIVTVFDPREIPHKNEYSIQGQLYCEFKYAPFSCKQRKQAQPDQDEKALSVALCRALQPAVCRHEFPNFQVDIFALVLQNSGASLAAAITCAGLALADAGVPMYDIVTAASIGVAGDLRLMDPTASEEHVCNITRKSLKPNENDEHGIIILSSISTHQQVSKVYQHGNLSIETVMEATDSLIEVNKVLQPLVQQCLVKNILKAVKQKQLTENVIAKDEK